MLKVSQFVYLNVAKINTYLKKSIKFNASFFSIYVKVHEYALCQRQWVDTLWSPWLLWPGLSFRNGFALFFQRSWRLQMSRWMNCGSVLSLCVRRTLCVRRRARAGLPLEAAFASGVSAIIPSSPDTILILTESDTCKVSRSGCTCTHAQKHARACICQKAFRNLLWSRSDTSFKHNNLIIYTITG